MATTAGLPLTLTFPDTEYCYVLKEIATENDKGEFITVKRASLMVMKKLLDHWSIRYVAIDSIISSRFLDAVETLFALHGMPAADKNLIENVELVNIINMEIPEWVKLCRQNNLPELEIREIIKNFGILPEIMCKTDLKAVKALSTISTPAKKVVEHLISKWNREFNPSESTVSVPGEIPSEVTALPSKMKIKPDSGLRRKLFEDSFENEKTESEIVGHPPVTLVPGNGSSNKLNSNSDTDEKYERAKAKLPNLPEFVGSQRGGDPWEWLDSVKRSLEFARCHSDDKLYVLKQSLTCDFVPFAKIEDLKPHNWKSYILALENHLRNPSSLSQALSDFQSLRWNWDCHPDKFIHTLEQLLIKVKGEPTPDELIFHILSRVPDEMYDVLVRMEKIRDLSLKK